MHFNQLPLFPLNRKNIDGSNLYNSYKFIDQNHSKVSIHYLQQVNCFVGSNNSGKSRLIREIYLASDSSSSSHDMDSSSHNFINGSLRKLERASKDFLKFSFERNLLLAKVIDIIESSLSRGVESIMPIYYYHGTFDDMQFLAQITSDYRNYSINEKIRSSTIPEKAYIEEIGNVLSNTRALIGTFMSNLAKVRLGLKNSRLYIPILRGARPLGSSDFYFSRTKKDYKIDNSFTGYTIYKDLQEHLLGSYKERELVKEFEDFLSKSFFHNQSISLIPRVDSDVVYIRIGEEERPLYDLGDGIQAIIVITFPLFMRKDKSWMIFIEEPEMHLHPKWQRFLIETFQKYFTNHQFFITTHSNVFLNFPNTSVYRVWKDEEDGKTAVQYLDNDKLEVLGDLGYKTSDLLQANYILWVEGASDKIYLKKMIEVFDPDLIEGVDYTVMFYGGCSQLKFLEISGENKDIYKMNISSINPAFGFVVDSDRTVQEGFNLEEEKRKFQEACTQNEKFCWISSVREMENLIPIDIWKQAALNYQKKWDKNYVEGRVTVDNVIMENENLEIADFAKTKIKEGEQTLIKINDKIKMAKEVIKLFPVSREDLTGELEEQITELVSRIKEAGQISVDLSSEE